MEMDRLTDGQTDGQTLLIKKKQTNCPHIPLVEKHCSTAKRQINKYFSMVLKHCVGAKLRPVLQLSVNINRWQRGLRLRELKKKRKKYKC